jgi:hypothetical protein
LVELEIEEVGDGEPSLLALKEATANGTDHALSKAATRKADGIVGRNSAKDIKSADTARVWVGNEFGGAFLARSSGITDQTTNKGGIFRRARDLEFADKSLRNWT